MLHGAVVTAESGPVTVGAECVVMEHAVLRGTLRHPLIVGEGVLVGPQAHLSGCEIGAGAFVATGVTVLNGARIGRKADVRIRAVVHVNSHVDDRAVVPIGWVAVGRPARSFPAADHDGIWAIQQKLDFPGTVFGAERVDASAAIRRYARALRRHASDQVLRDGERDG